MAKVVLEIICRFWCRYVLHQQMRIDCIDSERPNQAMERTATRRVSTLSVAKSPSLQPAHALGGRRSSCSR
jgi:hypothetical protein